MSGRRTLSTGMLWLVILGRGMSGCCTVSAGMLWLVILGRGMSSRRSLAPECSLPG